MSTLSSAINSATGYVQSTIGSLTGSTQNQVDGQAKQNEAKAENELSHTVGKVGGVAVSGSGGVAVDNPDRSAGSWNQTIGSGKETLGNLIGNQQLKKDGIAQNQQGQAQEAHGQLSDLGRVCRIECRVRWAQRWQDLPATVRRRPSMRISMIRARRCRGVRRRIFRSRRSRIVGCGCTMEARTVIMGSDLDKDAIDC